MKFTGFLICLCLSALLLSASGAPQRRQVQAALAAAFGQAMGEQVQKFVSTAGDYLLNALFGESPYTTIMGRGVKVTSNAGGIVSIKDIATGIVVAGYGQTQEVAMGDATANLITTLYKGGYISIDDLHLAPIRTTTALPCADAFPPKVCASYKNLGSCSPAHVTYSFAHTHCTKTCGGCS
ncbi:uncharacterized protein LOC125671797 isoform X2 [Ostrea edulis]|uniref:uncharacterized protein LOC125671797 isoform X2 n=1 Tax=Ostrea edulis TaxID=37623 RepID=UPI002095BEB1|nr:uncharacterized protein LOC125671797 isoform X2 [Ostrea edulis]